jgi:hypothetical protein
MIWNTMEILKDIFITTTSLLSQPVRLNEFVEQEEEKSDMEDWQKKLLKT